MELQLRDGEGSSDRSVKDCLERYEREITPHKKGARWESVRIRLLLRDELANVRLPKLSASDLAAWRDRRLRSVSGSSVGREMNLLSHVFSVARKEWKWIATNPLSDVRRPPEAPPRDRRVSQAEIDRLSVAAGYGADALPVSVSARAMSAFLFAIETGMRCGEICGLNLDDINTASKVVTIRDSKSGYGRKVPLSGEALNILKRVGRARKNEDPVFGLEPERTSALFRKIRLMAKIDGLTFHDSRHEAITRLAKKLNVLDLARMVGHRDIRQLQTYYNRTAEDMAGDL
jgi:integrase